MRVRSAHLVAVAATVVLAAGISAAPGSTAAVTYDKPEVTAVVASTGSTVGRLPVVLDGRRFEHVHSVTFGRTKGIGLHVVSAHRLTVYAPGHVHGTVPVTVHAQAGSSPAGRRARFIYVHAGQVGTWTGSAAPLPSGTTTVDNGLTQTSCPTATICYSIGDVSGAGDPPRAFQQYRSGSYRSAHFLPSPSGVDPRYGSYPVALDCPAVAACGAVTSTGTDSGLLSLHDGVFTAVRATPPGGAIAQTDLRVDDVSCAAPGDCLAIGQLSHLDQASPDYRVLIFRLHDGTWTSSYVPVPVPDSEEFASYHVSCPTVAYCAALVSESDRSYLVAITGSATTVRPVPDPPAGTADDPAAVLDCPAAQHCALADPAASYLLTTDGGSFTYRLVHPPADAATSNFDENADPALTCPGTTTCYLAAAYRTVGGGERAAVARLLGSTVHVYPMPETSVTDHRTGLTALACPSTQYCVAVGGRGESVANRFGTYDVFDDGVWTPGVFGSVAGQPAPSDLEVSDIDCAAAGSCFVTGDYAFDRGVDGDSGMNVYTRSRAVSIAQH